MIYFRMNRILVFLQQNQAGLIRTGICVFLLFWVSAPPCLHHLQEDLRPAHLHSASSSSSSGTNTSQQHQNRALDRCCGPEPCSGTRPLDRIQSPQGSVRVRLEPGHYCQLHPAGRRGAGIAVNRLGVDSQRNPLL